MQLQHRTVGCNLFGSRLRWGETEARNYPSGTQKNHRSGAHGCKKITERDGSCKSPTIIAPPPLGPRKPSDQTPAAQIGPGLWSPARSFRSAREQELAGRDAALRRCRCRRLSPVEDAGQLAASAFQTRGSSRKRDGQPADFGGCPRAAASSGKETAGALRHQHCWPLTVRSSSALERTLDRMQCDEHPADMRLHNLQRQVAARPHAWIS